MKIFQPFLLGAFLVSFVLACGTDTVDARYKFLGTYEANQFCPIMGNSSYTMEITIADDNMNEILLGNFADSGLRIRATVLEDQFTIPEYSLFARTYSGNGAITADGVSIFYRTSNNALVSCTIELRE